MNCVILAAGEGMRMRPLTETTPKPMLKLGGKQILEHIIESLPDEIDRIILVIGYLGDQIKDYFGDNFAVSGRSHGHRPRRFKVEYVVQEKKLGTYDALSLCKDYLDDEKFLLLYADDLHGREGLRECADSKGLCLLVSEAEDPTKFGVIELGDDGYIKSIEEKPEHPKSNLVSTGVLLLDKTVFNFPAKPHPGGEHYVTESLEQMIKHGYKIAYAKSSFWLPIGYPEDLKKAEEILK